MTSQTISGKAFEFGIAAAFAHAYGCEIVDNAPARTAIAAFNNRPREEQEMIRKTAQQSVRFLLLHDRNLTPCAGEWEVWLQPDSAGKSGDVRDVVIKTPTGLESGVSAKNRNDSVKHSRLSDKIDFGSEWAGIACSSSYFTCGRNLFSELREAQTQGKKWREIDITGYSRPLLKCFEEELKVVCAHPGASARVVRYLCGRKDFYKIIKFNGTINLQSFNMDNTLGWGHRINLPKRLVDTEIDANAKATLNVTFSDGWLLSFRLHHAETKVTPSLKFDIRLIGCPTKVSNHLIDIASISLGQVANQA